MADDNLQETAVIDVMRRRGRRRLVGAIVLALVAIIFVPVLLQKSPEPLSEEVEIVIPPIETPPSIAQPSPTPPTEPAAEMLPGTSLETPPETLPEAQPVETPQVETPSPPQTSLPKTVKLADGTFSVQLGAYTDDKGANAMVNRLKRAGYPAYSEPNLSRSQMVWRVRVGPFKSRSDAATVLAQLKRDGHNGLVVLAR
ncbi:MAG: SPOR domain-containing protein [Burkholderiales bacterium]|jgi:DedD protein|nr:SPOR domain-containing protein [Burkholderiales bacterium]